MTIWCNSWFVFFYQLHQCNSFAKYFTLLQFYAQLSWCLLRLSCICIWWISLPQFLSTIRWYFALNIRRQFGAWTSAALCNLCTLRKQFYVGSKVKSNTISTAFTHLKLQLWSGSLCYRFSVPFCACRHSVAQKCISISH